MLTLEDHIKWFEEFRGSPQYERLQRRPIAYFCTEYGLNEDTPIYAGGLGVLAGDMIKEANDQKLPLVAVGLYYHQGYACRIKEVAGKPVEVCEDVSPDTVGFDPVLDDKGEKVKVTVPIQDREVTIQAWKWRNHGIDLYVLDTDVAENTPQDRIITNRLYVGDKETRLKQEIVLGIGGLRLIEKLGYHPSLYHLNEGHSAFLAMELIRHQMEERGLDFHEAKQFAKRRIVMTNHTLVAAGNEIFSNDLVSLELAKYAESLNTNVNELVKLGLVQESSLFSMTMLALRMAGVVNAVSELHSDKAREIWTDHPMVPVTNGVHIPTWDMIDADVSKKGEFWRLHQERKQILLDHIKLHSGRDWDKDTLLLGWARRIVSYKRPKAILDDVKRFAQIARNADRPVRLVYAGRPHPSDQVGAKMVKEMKTLIDGELKDVAVFLDNYGIDLAQKLVSGTDVWLNTPVVGYEACGTSGMKAAICGSLPCSTNDGWVAEAELLGIGWIINNQNVTEDLLSILENDIAPMYYDRNGDGVPEKWEEHMRNSRIMGLNQFSATRMLRGYIELMYL